MSSEKIRDSFIFYRSFFQSTKRLSKEDKAELFEAICSYALDGESIEVSAVPEAIFSVIKPNLDANRRKWENGCKEKKKPSKSEAEEEQEISKSEANNKQTISKAQGNVNVDDNVNEECKSELKSKSETKKKPKGFIPPTLQDIQNYCKERNNSVSASKFLDYYSVSEWKDKDGKAVKNWKQKLLSWEGRDTTTASIATPKDSFAESINQQIGQDLVASVTEKPDYVQVTLHSSTACDKWMKIPKATRDQIAQQIRDKFNKEPKLKF